MRSTGLIAALVIVVLTNAVVLAGVAWNRNGEPSATLQITQRELLLHPGAYYDQENTGVAFSLSLAPGSRTPDWLDAAKLQSLGFDPADYTDDPDRPYYEQRKPLPRKAFVVLEYEGPAWQAILKTAGEELEKARTEVESGSAPEPKLAAAEGQYQRMQQSESRLVAVDAGTDAEALRARYPDETRYAIVGANVRMYYHPGREKLGESNLYGTIWPLVDTIHVPSRFHEVLKAAMGRDTVTPAQPYPWAGAQALTGKPAYGVTLHYGRRLEPWIEGIEPLPEAGPQ